MPLKVCPACQTRYSDKAPGCPRCARTKPSGPPAKPKSLAVRLGLGAIALSLLTALFSVLEQTSLTRRPYRTASSAHLRTSRGAYTILEKAFGPRQVTLWVRVKPDATPQEIREWGDELRGEYAEGGKYFVIVFYDGPRTDDGSHIIGEYSDGNYIDSRES